MEEKTRNGNMGCFSAAHQRDTLKKENAFAPQRISYTCHPEQSEGTVEY